MKSKQIRDWVTISRVRDSQRITITEQANAAALELQRLDTLRMSRKASDKLLQDVLIEFDFRCSSEKFHSFLSYVFLHRSFVMRVTCKSRMALKISCENVS